MTATQFAVEIIIFGLLIAASGLFCALYGNRKRGIKGIITKVPRVNPPQNLHEYQALALISMTIGGLAALVGAVIAIISHFVR